jgi:hypothetical protein
MTVLKMIGAEGWRTNENMAGGAAWREKMRVLWEMLHRNMRDARVQRQALYPKTWQSHVQRVVPFVWRVAREMASMKRSRSFVDLATGELLPQGTLDLIRAIYAEARVDAAMQAAYGQVVTLNQSTIWLFPRGRNGESLRCMTMPPHEQWVELADPLAQVEDDVSAWHVAIPVQQDITRGYTRYSWARFTADAMEWDETFPPDAPPPFGGPNLFGRIPVVYLRGGPPELGVWWSEAPDDLLDAARAINHDQTDQGHIARLQGYSQMYASGLSKGEAAQLDVGPEKVIGLDDPASRLDFARAQPDLAGYAATSEQYMRAVISAEGLNPATFLKSAGITALAKKMEMIDRDNERTKYMDELERGEQRLFDLIRTYINTQRGAEVIPLAKVVVEFREPVTPADPLHDAQALELQTRLGLIGKVRARAKADGISMDEALARMLQDQEMDARLASVAVAEEALATMEEDASEEGGRFAVDIPPEDDVQALALNGAQVSSLQGIIESVALGQLPGTAARGIIKAAFPAIPQADVDAMVSSAEGFMPRPPAPEVSNAGL